MTGGCACQHNGKRARQAADEHNLLAVGERKQGGPVELGCRVCRCRCHHTCYTQCVKEHTCQQCARLELTISYSWGKKSVKAQDTRARYDDLKRLTTGASEGMNTPTQ